MRRALALTLALAGCGDGGSVPPDAGSVADAHIAPVGCTPSYQRLYILKDQHFLPIDQGRDLDGDGDVDNIIGFLSDVINPVLAGSYSPFVFELQGAVLPPSAQPQPIVFAVAAGRDADTPRDRSNDFTGEGRFLAPLEHYDAWCRPLSRAEGFQDGLRLTAHNDHLEISLVGGTTESRDAHFDATLAADGRSGHLVSSGVMPVCSAAASSFPGSAVQGTILDGLARVIQPDIDLDGDGRERVEVENGRVARCFDGDGTLIEAAGCPCDPRMADGYSFASAADFVPARIVGTYFTTH